MKIEKYDEIQKILSFLENVNFKSESIQEFVDSLRDFFFTRGYLTDKQYHALMNIYERL